MKRALLLGSCVAALSLLAVPANAQQQVPTTAQPDQVIKQLDRDRPEPRKREEVISVPDSGTATDGRSTEKIFALKGIAIEGNTIYSQEQINAVLGDRLGAMTSFADLGDIAQLLTLLYRNDGYMFSRVVLTPQTVEGGIVKFRAVEGKITEVTVLGDYDEHFDHIAKLANKIRSKGPSNTKELERYLLLIDDLPGITARSVLKPSKTPGGGEIVINIEQDHFEGFASIDNRGSRFLGRHRGTVVAAFNSLFDSHDRTTIRGISSLYANQTEELKFFDVTHEQQVGYDGLRVSGRVAVTSTEPGGSIRANDIEGNSNLVEFTTLYPLVRSREFNINLLAGFHHLNSQSSVLGLQVSKDRVRSATIGARFDFFDQHGGINQIDLEIAKGLSIFGETQDGIGRSRANGEHSFLRTNVTATRIQDLPWNKWSAYLSAEGQYSRDALLASEEFAVGGPVYGRAYDSGEITGDHGLAGVAEIRYGEPVAHDWINSYQFFGFYDFGIIWNKGNVVGDSIRQSLVSAGAGMRFNMLHDISGSFEVNKPLTHRVSAEGSGGDGVRAFFSLSKRF